MEINLQNLEHLPQEWKHSKIGNATADIIIQARSTNTLRVSNEEDIKQVLRYSMLLVGLRGNNMPTKEEKFVLLNFIKSSYGNFTVAEIKLAFEMAIAGKFTIDAKCYENFSCEYFGRIMNAYSEFARNETRSLTNQFQEPEPIPVPTDAELKNQAINALNSYADLYQRNEDFFITLTGLQHLYDIAVRFDLLAITKPEKDRIWIENYYKFKTNEERIAYCKQLTYKLAISNMVDFGMRLDAEGNIKQIEE